MDYEIPGLDSLSIKTIILDLNGTISVGGQIPDGVKDRLQKLRQLNIELVLFTGNTRGDADDLCADLGIEWKLASNAQEKKELAEEMDPEFCATIGNGRIDAELMKVCQVGVVTLQAEGVHSETFKNADLMVPNINDALDLFIYPERLIASLRK